MKNIIETQGLHFGYNSKEQTIVDVSLEVPKGSIYGFLGPNGAGKSTTIRLITGLLGNFNNIKLFDMPLKTRANDIYKHIGTLIESPSLYGHLTAKENLHIACKYHNCALERANEVLEIVALANTGNKKVRQFSMGMKQRLGIALALIPNPELLILDEPVNGLDPQGIREIRELIIRLNKEEGKTIFLSSHLLSEIEKTCTHVGIIHQGKLIFQDTMAQLKAKQKGQNMVCFSTSNTMLTLELLLKQFEVQGEKISNSEILIPTDNKALIASMNKSLVEANIEVYQIAEKENSLEDWFLETLEN